MATNKDLLDACKAICAVDALYSNLRDFNSVLGDGYRPMISDAISDMVSNSELRLTLMLEELRRRAREPDGESFPSNRDQRETGK